MLHKSSLYLNFDEAIKKCNLEDIKIFLDELLDKYEFITVGFIREKSNERLIYEFSNYYYDSLIRIIAKEKSWFYSKNYLSKRSKKKESLGTYIKRNYNWSITSKENYEEISKKAGISFAGFSIIIYKPEFKFNTESLE